MGQRRKHLQRKFLRIFIIAIVIHHHCFIIIITIFIITTAEVLLIITFCMFYLLILFVCMFSVNPFTARKIGFACAKWQILVLHFKLMHDERESENLVIHEP